MPKTNRFATSTTKPAGRKTAASTSWHLRIRGARTEFFLVTVRPARSRRGAPIFRFIFFKFLVLYRPPADLSTIDSLWKRRQYEIVIDSLCRFDTRQVSQFR